MARIRGGYPSRLAEMPKKLTERQRRLYHQMESATATADTGRTKEGRPTGLAVGGSVVTLKIFQQFEKIVIQGGEIKSD